MNATLRRTAVALGVLFLALMLNVTFVGFVKSHDYRARPGNTRLIIEEYGHERGPILVGGTAVARSVATKDRLKYRRVYPQAQLYAPVTGYYSLYDATGMERAENALLSGSDDRLFVDRLTQLLTGRQPRGGSVELTLDAAAQRAAMTGLARFRGAVAAIDPRTGAVLALASSPSFDPNALASHDPAKVSQAYDQYLHAPGDPLLDRPIQQLYPPGSLFKVVTAAAALSSGSYTPDTVIPAPESIPLPQSTARLHNYDRRPCLGGSVTLTQALEISCNTAFARVGMDVGAAALQAQAEAFGFGTRLLIPLPVVPSVFPSGIDKAQTALSAIGQFDVRATALQMAMVGAGVANRGLVMTPYLVAEELAPDLSVLSATQPVELSRAVSPQVAQELSDMMVSVVENGTGTNAAIPGVTVAGKTGTAQTGKGQPPDVWFMAFAPAEDPKVAVAVVIEDGGGLGSNATGGALAAPIAKAVMEAVLRR